MTAQAFAPEKTKAVQKKLAISEKLSLPMDAALWTLGFLAIKEAGKTYDASVLAEELIKNGIPIVVLDTMGIWWGLQVGVDGHEGLPVVVFGGKHKNIDIPMIIEKGFEKLDEERLRKLVLATLKSRISAVLDTSELSKIQQRRVVGVFTDELVKLNQDYGIRHVFIEEADRVVPQKLSGKEGNAAFVSGAVKDLVTKGGNYNLGVSLLSQRAAVIDKDVLTQINCLVALQIIAKRDKKAVSEWVETVGNPEDKRLLKFADSLKNLHKGEAWIWHPESENQDGTPSPEIFKRVQFRKRETLHATRAYFLKSDLEKQNAQPMDVSEFVQAFKSEFEPKKIVQTKTIGETISQGYEKAAKQSNIIPIPHETEKIIAETNRIFQEAPNEKQAVENIHQYLVEQQISTAPVKQFDQPLPNIQINQYKPNLTFGVELPNEPDSILGKVCVVLKKGPPPYNRNDRWNVKLIGDRIRDHSWDTQGYEDAVEQLIRWEVLTRASNYLRFDPKRVAVVERS